ncbi:Tetratricopeptide TPR_1 repeat-containing protein [uncultured Paludibacter sp.]|uniref:Tetratricopeptide TPR_1 repeat-containing protein n=1 Tax=uncultured Paludibacter sp. TaxID=497635 RepID=A0A653ALA2_9BACT|nr:Tetratricopeptide TPR_1 repeat-containing protein [uncultured Paludibacter sp.]
MAKKETTTSPELENVGLVLSKSEQFIEKHQKQILIGVGIVVAIVLAVLAFRNYYMKPRVEAAENAIYKAQSYFAIDSFKVALEGNGSADMIGFKEIASEYGMTPSGKLATAYAGICYYKLGDYKNAVKFLSQYEGKDEYFKTSVIGLTGDAYAEMGETNKAFDFYKKVAATKNELAPIYLKKAGILYETKEKPDEALKMYKEIKEKYPTSMQAGDIDKYIARVEK